MRRRGVNCHAFSHCRQNSELLYIAFEGATLVLHLYSSLHTRHLSAHLCFFLRTPFYRGLTESALLKGKDLARRGHARGVNRASDFDVIAFKVRTAAAHSRCPALICSTVQVALVDVPEPPARSSNRRFPGAASARLRSR